MATNKEQRIIEIIVAGEKANASIKEMSAAAAVMANQVRKMAADDPKRAELVTQLQTMRNRIKEASDEMLGLKKSEEAVHLANLQLIEDGTKINASLGQMKTAAVLLEKQLETMAADDPNRQKLIADYQLLKKRIDETTEATYKNKKSQAELHQEFVQIIADGQKIDASFDELERSAAAMNKQLRSMSTDDPGRAKLLRDYELVSRRFNTVKGEIDNIAKAQKEVTLSAAFMQSAWSTALGVFAGGGALQIVTSVVSSIKSLGQESISFAAKTSDSLADIRKASGLTKEEVVALNEEFKNIDTRTSQAALQDIAIVGGQIGVAKDQIDEFTEATDKAVVALGDEFTGGAAEVAKSMGSLQKLFKETKDLEAGDAINKIGSAINALSADGTATGPVVADFTQRIGQLGDLAPEISQTLGLGAAFQELGLTAEISAGGLSNILLTAAKGTDAFAKQIGITEEQFKKLINSNPNEVILRLAESLKGASNTEIVQTLDSLDIKSQEATKVMSLLASKTDFVREKQALASVEMEKATSLTDEFNIKNTTAAAEIEKSEKKFAQLKEEIGQGLIPIYLKILVVTGSFIDIIRRIPKFVDENKIAIGLLVLGLATWNKELIVSNALALKDIAVKQVQAIWNSRLVLATRSLNATMAANPIGAVVTVVALLVLGFMQLYERSQTVRAGLAGVFEVVSNLGTRLKALIVGLTTGNWDMVKSAFSGIGKEIADNFNKGYQEKVDSEKVKQIQKEAKQHEQAKVTAKKKGTELGQATSDGFAESLKGMNISQLKDLLETETDKTHKSLIRKQIDHLKNIEKEQNKEIKQEEKHQDKLKEAREKYLDANQKAELEFQKLKVDAMNDGIDKVLAKLRLKHSQEIKELENHKKEVLANIGATEAEKQALIDTYNEQQKIKDEELRLAELEAQKEASKKKLEENFTAAEEHLALEAELIENEYLQKQAAFDDQLLRTIEAENERDLALLEQKQITAQTKLAYLVASGQGETLQAEKLKNDLLRIDKERTDTLIKNEQNLTKIKRDMANQVIGTTQEAFRVGIDLLGKDTAARKAAVTAHKAFSVGKIAIDATQEIQAIWRNANSNALNILIPGWGPAFAAVQTALAVGRAVKATKEVTAQQFYDGGMTGKSGKKARINLIEQFYTGGMTGQSGNKALIKMAERNGIWEMVSGQSGGSIGSFAEGGWQNEARLGLIGEKGAELVIPNWMIKSPKYANTVGWLESERKKGVSAFAVGGGTLPEPMPGAPEPEPNAELTNLVSAMLAKMDEMNTKMESWPKQLKVINVVSETEDELKVLNDLRDWSNG